MNSSQEVSYFPHKFNDIWESIKALFNTEIKTILDINLTFYKGNSKFFKEIEDSYPEEGIEFLKVYNNLRDLVLNIETIFQHEINILQTGATDKIILTRKQVALIFILGFFEIFERGQGKLNTNERFSFYNILSSSRGADFSKGRCFLNYLTVIGKWIEEKNPLLEEKVAYIRENRKFNIKDYIDKQKLCDIVINEKGSLFESDASFCVDFANKYIGGGALSGGCVQEEILFAVEPEAIVSIFLMQKMDNNDAIRIDNLIQYSNYSGYGYTFKFEENAIKNNEKLIKHNIIAIDAVCSSRGGLDEESVERDLIKAFIGFNLVNFDDKEVEKKIKTISTGNWGCGAFGGDFELKFIQQWLAATFAGVEKLYYYTFKRNEMNFAVKNVDNIRLIKPYELYLRLTKRELEKRKVLEIIMDDSSDNIIKLKQVPVYNSNSGKRKKCCCWQD